MIITSKELFEEYTQNERKLGFITRKAKELKITRSQVIAELLKSGYKLEELKRLDKNNYNAGVNKYKQWIEDGSPEQTYKVPEVVPEVKEKKKYEKPEPVIVSESETEEEMPKSALITALKETPEDNLDMAKFRLRIADLEDEIERLKKKIRENEDLSLKFSELQAKLNVAESDAETNQNAMVAEYQKRIVVEAKLRKAERIICDCIYEDMPDEAE